MSKKGFLFGALAGATLGVLFAPRTGKETRKELKLRFNEMVHALKEVDTEEVKINIENKIKELRDLISEMDREKAMALAEKQAKVIRKKADELVDAAVKAAKPGLEKIADKTRETAIKATKEVLLKLETKK